MTVLLCTSREPPSAERYDCWLATTGAASPPGLDPLRRLPRLAARLEQAFVESRELWWRLGREMGAAPGGDVAHAPTGGAFGSDFGVMLAWSRLVDGLASEAATCLVLCDDPWLFRHLADRGGVRAGAPPPLWPRRLLLAMRGWLARAKVALKAASAAVRLRGLRGASAGGSALLVYGHPESDAAGHDAYFGSLMTEMPDLERMLHTDCPPARASELARDGRTGSLHAFGNPLYAPALLFERWRPARAHARGPLGWLVRRAAAKENGGGGPAMNRWQCHCQQRWLRRARPRRVAWPWENHAWERALCRAARRLGVATLGYQHTVVGPHQLNYSPATNPDGLASLPDLVVANGPAYRRELAAFGVPPERLAVGGAFRFAGVDGSRHDPGGPVFVPLSAIPDAARAQLKAARLLAAAGRRVLVKEHPMYPLPFAEAPNLARASAPLARQQGLAAVVYATGTSGLEALLLGIPTYRLLLEDRIAIDVLPEGLSARPVTLEDAVSALAAAGPPPAVRREDILAPVDLGLWRRWLGEAPAAAGRRPAPALACAT
jgi:hypothetical protein